MKNYLGTGLIAILFITSTASAATHQARCEINDGEALAWISAQHDNIEVQTKAVMRVFDQQGDLIYKTSKRKSFALDAYDTEKVYAVDVGYDARWCELDLRDTEIAVHNYAPPTVIHHHHPASFPFAPIVIYKQPRRETVVVERNRPVVRVYENSRSRRERVIVRPPRERSHTRVKVQIPPIRVKF